MQATTRLRLRKESVYTERCGLACREHALSRGWGEDMTPRLNLSHAGRGVTIIIVTIIVFRAPGAGERACPSRKQPNAVRGDNYC